MLSTKDWDLIAQVNCEQCSNKDACDQVKYDCPRIDFKRDIIEEA